MGLRKSHEIFLLKGFNEGKKKIDDKYVIKEPPLLELGIDGATSGPAWAGKWFSSYSYLMIAPSISSR